MNLFTLLVQVIHFMGTLKQVLLKSPMYSYVPSTCSFLCENRFSKDVCEDVAKRVSLIALFRCVRMS